MRRVMKALGAVLAVIALCAPLIFWPVDEYDTGEASASPATVTVPPTVVVATTGSTSTVSTSSADSGADFSPASTTTTTQPIDITIAAAGDVLIHTPILESARDLETDSYDFTPLFVGVAPYLEAADYTVVNLETRLAGAESGYSGFPRFNSPAELADALKNVGVDLVATANNHALDLGWEGIVSTLDHLDAASLEHVGTYRTAAERATPLVVDIGGIKVGFLNYTAGLNGINVPAECPYAVNILDVEQVASDAAMARLYGAELVIAMLHYGNEYEREPNEEQTALSRELLSRGVDVILGSHPHVVQPISHIFEYTGWKVTDKYIAYSLGNFISNQRWRYSDSGIVAYIHVQKRGLRAYVTGVSYLPIYVQKGTIDGQVGFRVLPVLPGLEPDTDIPLSAADRERMTEVWEELRPLLYSPNQGISPLVPSDLSLHRSR